MTLLKFGKYIEKLKLTVQAVRANNDLYELYVYMTWYEGVTIESKKFRSLALFGAM